MTAFFFYFLVNIQGAFEALQPFNKLHALHELRRRARAPRAARRLHDPRHGGDRLHRRPDLRAARCGAAASPSGSTGSSRSASPASSACSRSPASSRASAGQQGIPEVNVLPQLHAYYIARGIFGAMIVVSGIVQIVNIGMTIFTDTAERRRRETLQGRRGGRAAGGGLSMADELGRTRSDERRVPRGWARHPPERMLITPLVAGRRRPDRVLHRRRRSSCGCRSTPSTRRRRPTGRRSPTQAVKGRNLFALERLLRLPLRLLAAAGRARARSTSSTRRSRSRATSTAATSRRTCSAPSAPGPTSRRSRAGTRTTGSARTSTTRASSTRCR